MLIPGQIPNTEPMIRVGIVLPEDKLQSIQISFSDPQCFEIDTGDRLHPACKNNDQSTVNIEDGKIILSDVNITASSIKIIPSIPHDNPFITLKGVTAGRGFHWEKQITASFWGSLEFSIYEDNLMVVNELPLEQYISCVATSEMSPQCPPEFLKAQTIVARSWLLANIEQKHRHLGFDICNDDCCQRYQGIAHCTPASIQSAEATFGQVIMFDDQICDARYSKSCGGITENYEHVWDGDPVPYLVSIMDVNENGIPFCSPEIVPEDTLKSYIGDVDEKGQYYRWTYEVNQAELIHSLKEKRNLSAVKILDLNPTQTGTSGRIIDLLIEYEDEPGDNHVTEIHSEYEIRNIMSHAFLYSSAFTVEKTDDGNFLLHGKGWGHGVGMCQIGALGMAFSKCVAEKILCHYYPNTELRTLYRPLSLK